MPNHPVNPPPERTRQHASDDISRSMTRFPLVMQILSELAKCHCPLPGDADIRHGCQRALTAMLAELARIQPAPIGMMLKPEELTQPWLYHPDAERLIDVEVMQRIHQLVDRILNIPDS